MNEETRDVDTGAELEQAVDEATDAATIRASQLQELTGGAVIGEGMSLAGLLDVPVQITVEVGRTRMTLGELVRLGPGSLVELDREAHEPADVLVNGKVVARGEIVTIDRSYGVRITTVDS